jgi:hypothetical protein
MVGGLDEEALSGLSVLGARVLVCGDSLASRANYSIPFDRGSEVGLSKSPIVRDNHHISFHQLSTSAFVLDHAGWLVKPQS